MELSVDMNVSVPVEYRPEGSTLEDTVGHTLAAEDLRVALRAAGY